MKRKGRERVGRRKTVETLKQRVIKEAVRKPAVHGGSVPERSWPPEYIVKAVEPAKPRKR